MSFPAPQPVSELMHHRIRPNVRARDRLSQPLNVIAGTPPPWDVPQVKVVGDPEVRERHETVLVDSVPEA